MKVTMKQVTDFIFEQYDITFLPKHFYMQLAKIPKGEYKGLNQSIPFEDLLDMWQRKMPYLQKVYHKNCDKGKKMDGIGRIMYDLAILLGKYDSYLEWKSSQATNEVRKNEDNIKIDYQNISTAVDNTDDMNNILDDIWIE